MTRASVLVCTRNRPDSLLRTVRSLLEHPGAFELIVMDQSQGTGSEHALAAFAGDPRLRYMRTRAQGKGASLNEGLRLARAAIVVCTDDDCVAPPGWPEQMARVMEAHPRAAVAFCNVTAEPYDKAAGYVPTYERTTDRVLTSIGDVRAGLGLGAGMALRKDVVLALGGFDETFGPGSRFRSGDDWDISLRALLQGWHVVDTASTAVVHYGYRTFAEGREHALRDWIAIGALCARPIRSGHLSAIGFAGSMFVGQALWPPVRDLLALRRPSGRSRVIGFMRGFWDGLRTSVDPRTLAFRPHAGVTTSNPSRRQ